MTLSCTDALALPRSL